MTATCHSETRWQRVLNHLPQVTFLRKRIYKRGLLSESSSSTNNFDSEKDKDYIQSNRADELLSGEAKELKNVACGMLLYSPSLCDDVIAIII
jgi:hypothetical protein